MRVNRDGCHQYKNPQYVPIIYPTRALTVPTWAGASLFCVWTIDTKADHPPILAAFTDQTRE